jgi:ubiquitin-conjugating enzyme E2 S
MRVTLPPDFPASPPACAFATKLFHPNVSTAGAVCVNVLKKDWAPALGLRHVLVVVRCLLIEPFAESALNEEAGRLLLEDYAAFASRAALMASVHAGAGKGGSGAAARAAPRPLTASAGPNALGGGAEPGADDGKAARPAPGAPRSGAALKKRSLKRL